ncbi:Crp/Fnr family transcriptional regulator [Agathobaculum sp.]|uniref:Crp/Fnr family transcriptional regulator n=1 Tax=Agathobaculum sp. TaxID=2048138 RepID=UPI002A836B9E|nr:Crp/Fnr family transcriptional regulator [Agathobaculum sp.]MDY3618783.1 Crp/Fnr family transcriptional regulator [Agathobaculum sp.]
MDYLFLSRTALFHGASAEEVESMLNCLCAVSRRFAKGAEIFRAGEVVSSMGLVLSGALHIENNDLWGNKSIINRIPAGHIFAETYACIPGEPLMVNVSAAEPCEVLFLSPARLLKTCPSACPHHMRLIQNLLAVTAQKNLALSRRILHTTPKTIRKRLTSYLAYEAARRGSVSFSIPFDRQQLADYLSVDRSALSNELSKMQRDGLLRVRKNEFVLTSMLSQSAD